MERCSRERKPYMVGDPLVTLVQIERRAALRRLWSRAGDATPLDRSIVARGYGLSDTTDDERWGDGTFGALHQRLARSAAAHRVIDRPPAAIDDALSILTRYGETIAAAPLPRGSSIEAAARP